MVKPLASGGGRGVRRWRPGSRLPARCYLQEFVDGVPGSVVFVAAGGRCSVLAVSRQLVGDAVFGAGGYRYCGSMMSLDPDDPWEGDRRLASAAHALADAASRSFRLVGVNGVDFVVRDGVPVAIEVNPRWSASMELVDRMCETPLMAAHEESCRSGAPPHVHRARDAGVTGKAIVFAKSRVTAGDTRRWIGSAGGATCATCPGLAHRSNAVIRYATCWLPGARSPTVTRPWPRKLLSTKRRPQAAGLPEPSRAGPGGQESGSKASRRPIQALPRRRRFSRTGRRI